MAQDKTQERDSQGEQTAPGRVGDPLGFDLLPERREGLLRGPVALAGALGAAVVIGAFLYLSDQNSDRWELRCSRDDAEPRRGLYFPWGTRRLPDDAHHVLALPQGVSCASLSFSSLQELDLTLADLLLESAEHRLQQGSPEALAHARQDVERARRLTGLTTEERQRAEDLLADMAYHEARDILRKVERDLWQARRKLDRARSLGAASRIGDLGEWIQFVEAETERFRPALGSGEPRVDEPESAPPDAGAPTEPSPAQPTEEMFL